MAKKKKEKQKMANSFDKYLEFKVDFGKWNFENFFNPTAFRWNYQTTPFSNFAVPVVISIFYLISIYVLTVSFRFQIPIFSSFFCDFFFSWKENQQKMFLFLDFSFVGFFFQKKGVLNWSRSYETLNNSLFYLLIHFLNFSFLSQIFFVRFFLLLCAFFPRTHFSTLQTFFSVICDQFSFLDLWQISWIDDRLSFFSFAFFFFFCSFPFFFFFFWSIVFIFCHNSKFQF